MKTPTLSIKSLIVTILIVATVTIGYALWLWYLYAKPFTLPGARNLSIEVPAIEPRFRLDPKAYIFTPDAWKLKPVEKPKKKRESESTEHRGPLPLLVDTASRPMKFCIGKKCYEVLGYTGDAVVLDRSKEGEEEDGLVLLRPGQSLQKRIRFDGIEGSTVKFYDQTEKKPFTLRFFEVDPSKFAPKNQTPDKTETHR